MKINISGISSEKTIKLFNDALTYFCSKLMTNKMSNSLTVNLSIKKDMMVKGSAGGCWAESNGSKPSKEINIEISSDSGIGDQLEYLAHESVHLWQRTANTLQYRVWKTDDSIHVRWNGQDFGVNTFIDYEKSPWEMEAYKMQKPLYHGFLVKQFGDEGEESKNAKEISVNMRSIMNERSAQSEFVY
jgi:hypothetical protein